ncbi:hypothetical protein FACS189434_07980 [Bacteroidia bacterium]|nr:hypothetical protein FACS189434_07980 [Bacteroidia bacterium]
MIDCLVGYIGLCSSEGTAQSGLYLDALPDINLYNTGKIADSSQKTENGTLSPDAVFEDVQKRAILKFRTLFIIEFNRCFKEYNRTNIECLICENKVLLATALWYLMGAEMLQERLGSERINRFTTIDRQKTRELQQEFMQDFANELQMAIAGIDIEASACFENEMPECNADIQFVETCP